MEFEKSQVQVLTHCFGGILWKILQINTESPEDDTDQHINILSSKTSQYDPKPKSNVMEHTVHNIIQLSMYDVWGHEEAIFYLESYYVYTLNIALH